MRTDRRQDPGMDRLLRTALNGAAGGTAEGCPGPDEMSGYLEHALPSEEMRSLERHFAACDRCQEVLATLAVMRGDTSETAVPDGWWSSHPWRRWLVPAAAVASALILYIALKPQLATESIAPKPLEPSTTIAQQLPSTPAPPMAAPAIAMPPPPPPPQRGISRAGASSAAAPPPAAALTAPPAIGGHPGVPSAPPSASPEGSRAFMRASARADRANAKEEGVAKQVQPEAKQGGATTTTVVADAANKPSAQPMKAAAEAPPAPPASGAVMEMLTVVEPGRAAGRRQAAAPVVVRVATGGATRWLVGPGAAISRSNDSGASWQVQKTPGKSDLLAGAAPSATVCWVVGAAGTVLLTTDGSHWNARPFPERVDLVAVTADDGVGLEATVTTRDGRRFGTTDGGASWVLR